MKMNLLTDDHWKFCENRHQFLMFWAINDLKGTTSHSSQNCSVVGNNANNHTSSTTNMFSRNDSRKKSASDNFNRLINRTDRLIMAGNAIHDMETLVIGLRPKARNAHSHYNAW